MSWIASAGLLGAIAYFAVAGSVIRSGLETGSNQLLAGGVFGALLAYLIQGLASIDELSIRVAFWALLPALVIARSAEVSRTREKAQKPIKKSRASRTAAPLAYVWALPLLGLALLGAVSGATVLLVADTRAQEARASISDDAARGGAIFEQAVELRGDPYYRYLFGLAVGNAAVDASGGAAELLAQAESAFSYLEEFPDVRGLVGYGRILHEWSKATNDSRHDDALTQFNRALELDRWNPMIRVETSDVLIALEEFEDALDVLRPAIDLVGSDSHPEVWGAWALVNANLGNVAEAERAMAVSKALNPDDARANQAGEVIQGSSISD